MSRYTFVPRLFLVGILCAGSPTTGTAATFDDMKEGLAQSLSDAIKRNVDSVLGNQPTSNPSPGTQPETGAGQRAQAAAPPPTAGGASVAAGSAPGPMPARGKATPEQIEAAVAKYHDNCAVHTTYLRNMHDCECLTRGAREALTARKSVVVSVEEQYQLGQTCAAPKETIYAWVYQTCDDYMQHKRTDHTQFCACTGNRFSDAFRASPNSNLRKVEALRAASMKACGL